MGKNIKNKPKYKYQIMIHWSPADSAYLAIVPELENCISHGETQRDALEMAEDAIEAYIQSLKKRGEEVPQPLAEKAFSGNIPLRIEPALHRKLAIEASFEHKSLNKLISEKLKSS